jgi:hypothetical protein
MEHIGDCLLSYAGQLVARPDNRFVRFVANADKDATTEQVLEFAEAGGRILAPTARTTPTQVRAFHPSGQADPTGFAAMGCVEALLHGEDIAQWLGPALDPPREVCAGCSPDCSPTRRWTLSTSTRGRHCDGARAGSSYPAACDGSAGAALRSANKGRFL